MADITSVTGTLDNEELDFQASGGTTYSATALIDDTESEHVATITAEDSAGNSATQTVLVSVSGSWSTPKTDWYGATDSDGIYTGDKFNSEDFNRIKNNLEFLRNVAVTMYDEFPINELGDDRTKDQYFYADEITDLQDNIDIIAENTSSGDYGEHPVYAANGNIFDYNELNRIESAILDLYDQLTNQYKGRNMLTFCLGIKEVF